MEWLAQLQGQVVGLDSAPLIYFIEENPTHFSLHQLGEHQATFRFWNRTP